MTEEKETREKKRNGGGATDERGDDGVLGRRARARMSLAAQRPHSQASIVPSFAETSGAILRRAKRVLSHVQEGRPIRALSA